MNKLDELVIAYLNNEFLNDYEFWSLVSIGPSCWLWQGQLDTYGYGRYKLPGGTKRIDSRIKAHRLAYMLIHGFIPAEVNILHKCDNPPCCNPAHIVGGTQSDNTNDMLQKKRHSHGEKHSIAKLTEEQAIEIIALKKKGISPFEIAPKYGVTPSCIYNVGTNNWKHLILDA